MAIKGILDHSIKASWTLFIIIFAYLILILVRVWVTVGPIQQFDAVNVTGDLNPPRIRTKVEPIYPEQAKKVGITGDIQLEVHTGLRGNVISTKVLNVQPSFEQGFGIWHLYIAAKEAVSQWTFGRFYFMGHNREAIFTVMVSFK